MTEFWHIVHHMLFGAVAAAGFGVLFNMEARHLGVCAIGGAMALGIRTVAVDIGWGYETASFLAALVVGLAARGIHRRIDTPYITLVVTGCIPMIPGGFAAKAILGFFTLAKQLGPGSTEVMTSAVANLLHVILIVGAMGTGLAVPSLIRRKTPLGPRH